MDKKGEMSSGAVISLLLVLVVIGIVGIFLFNNNFNWSSLLPDLTPVVYEVASEQELKTCNELGYLKKTGFFSDGAIITHFDFWVVFSDESLKEDVGIRGDIYSGELRYRTGLLTIGNLNNGVISIEDDFFYSRTFVNEEYLIQSVETLNSQLIQYAELNNFAELKKVVEAGAAVSTDISGTIALSKASENGNLEMIKYLLMNGAGALASDEYKEIASSNGYLDVANFWETYDENDFPSKEEIELSSVLMKDNLLRERIGLLDGAKIIFSNDVLHICATSTGLKKIEEIVILGSVSGFNDLVLEFDSGAYAGEKLNFKLNGDDDLIKSQFLVNDLVVGEVSFGRISISNEFLSESALSELGFGNSFGGNNVLNYLDGKYLVYSNEGILKLGVLK